jgi:hypothetical protein
MDHTWEEVIGHGRERELLDTAMNVGLEIAADSDQPFDLITFLAECWCEGILVDAGYALDDLATLNWRLGRLTPEQRAEMLAAYN